MDRISAAYLILLGLLATSYCYDPKPNPKSVVTVGNARFTILTSRLIRMEWGQKVDAPTFTFLNRNLPVPVYEVTKDGDWAIIKTNDLKVYYLPDGVSFNENNLYVELIADGTIATIWNPKSYRYDKIGGNLLGTVRTLDGNDGLVDLLNCYTMDVSTHCTLGLISRDGYVVVDDTGLPQFDNSEWPWATVPDNSQANGEKCTDFNTEKSRSCGFPRISMEDCVGRGCCWDNSSSSSIKCYYGLYSRQDLYFFGHGYDYKGALYDFTLAAGKISLPPKYAFGVFFSRYWAYNDIGEMEIVREYRSRRIPLDNLVTDMDWHETFYGVPGHDNGWTGFTWDSHLFPNPKGFLDWCKAHKLKNTLNLHPHDGIRTWDKEFVPMAKAMGLDSSNITSVPWQPADTKFVNNFFNIVLKPLQDQGIDYWWLDWQQGESDIASNLPNVNPTFWINYIFSTNPYQWGPIADPLKRHFLLHRWGGLGNHRYQIGFSGDVIPMWSSLHFQVYFTLRASNVLFGFWSHDLGGHTEPSPPELYTRWVQWGAFSPIFRTHCTKNANNDRRIWTYPLVNYQIMREAMILRGALVPYIYTHARTAYDTGLSLLRAMYFEYPHYDESYYYDRQYFFGPYILVAPITEELDSTMGVVNKDIWIPPGSYVSWTHGNLLKGPQVISWNYTLWEIPRFVKSGSIIPMLTDGYNNEPLGTAQETPTSVKLLVFVGDAATGFGYLYDDDGVSANYDANFANTTFSYTNNASNSTMSITIDASVVKYTGFPTKRNYQIAIPNFYPADKVTVDGVNLEYCPIRSGFDEYAEDCWTYDGSTLSLIINILSMKSTSTPVNVMISYASCNVFDPYNIEIEYLNTSVAIGFTGFVNRLVDVKNLLDDQWGIHTVYQSFYPNTLNAVETGIKITYEPTKVKEFIDDFKTYASKIHDELEHINADPDTLKKVEAELTPQLYVDKQSKKMKSYPPIHSKPDL